MLQLHGELMKRMTSLRLALTAATLGVALVTASAWGQTNTNTSAAESAGTKAKPAKRTWVPLPRKHGGSGVQVRYNAPATTQPGTPVTVRVQFGTVTKDGATARFRLPAGMSFVGVDPGSVALPRGGNTEVELRVLPSADGLHYINVFTVQGGRTSAQSIPVKVGSGQRALKPNGMVQTTPSGEKVISLPSQ